MAEVIQPTPRARSTYFQLYPDRVPPTRDDDAGPHSSAAAPPAVAAPSAGARKGLEPSNSRERERRGSGSAKGKEREVVPAKEAGWRRARTSSISSLLNLASGKDKAREREQARDAKELDRRTASDGAEPRRASATSVYLGSLTAAGDDSGLPTTPTPTLPPTPRTPSPTTFRPLSPPRSPSSPGVHLGALRPGSSTSVASSNSFASTFTSHDEPRSPHLTVPTPASPERYKRSPSLRSSIFPSTPRSRGTSISSTGSGSQESPMLISNVFPDPPRRYSSRTTLSPATSSTSLSSSTSSLSGVSPVEPSDPLKDLFAGPATVNLKFDVQTHSYVPEDGCAAVSVSEMDDLVDEMNSTKSRPSSVKRAAARRRASEEDLHGDSYSSSQYDGVQADTPRKPRSRQTTASSTASVASSTSFASMTAAPSPTQVPEAAPSMARGDTVRPRLRVQSYAVSDPSLIADAAIAQQLIYAPPLPSGPSLDDIIYAYKADVAKAARQKSHRSRREHRAPTLARTASAPTTTSFKPPTVPPPLPFQSSATGPDRIKSIDEIIRGHAMSAPAKPTSRAPPSTPTPAQALAAASRTRETGYESDDSEHSVDSLEEEMRTWDSEQQAHALNHSRSFPSRDVADASDSRSTKSGISTQPTPRGGSPVNESEAAHVERELATLLKSPRLTRLMVLTRTPNQGLTVSLADVGSPHGHPVIVFLGLGCVRYLIALYDEMAEVLGLRLICIDRWGLGRTGEVPDDKRGFIEWSSVVAEVADQLELPQFSILAHSAGGPYALAASLRAPERIRGSIHLLAPWVSTSADSLAGAYKYLKYVPTGVLRTAQAADFKMQAWRLGKPPTIAQHGIGYNHRAGISSSDPSHITQSMPSSPIVTLASDFGPVDEGDDEGSDHLGSVTSNPELELAPALALHPARASVVNGRSLRGKGSKTFLGGLFGDRSKPSTASENGSVRSISGPRTGSSTPTRSFTPPASLRAGSRRISTISTSSDQSHQSPTDRALSPTLNSPTGGHLPLSGLELANGLLRASHAESLKGSTSDLMVILERTHKPWGFKYSDVGTAAKVWHGDKDDRISLTSVRWLESEMPDCRLTVVEGADHSMMTSASASFHVPALEAYFACRRTSYDPSPRVDRRRVVTAPNGAPSSFPRIVDVNTSTRVLFNIIHYCSRHRSTPVESMDRSPCDGDPL